MYLYDTMIIIINKEPINHVLGTRQKVNRAGDIRTVNDSVVYIPIFSTLQLLLENDTVIAEVAFLCLCVCVCVITCVFVCVCT